MYQLILISINSSTILGIYSTKDKDGNILTTPTLLYSLTLEGMTSKTLPLLFSFLLTTHTNSIATLSEPDIIESCTLQECTINLTMLTQELQNTLWQDSNNTHNHHSSITILSPALKEALEFLANFNKIESIYYARGVGSLSAIKLTHIFLHTLSLSKNIPIYATNSFYFSPSKEIKAFGNMSFFLQDDTKKHTPITDSNLHLISLKQSIKPDYKLVLPHTLLKQDFSEICEPLYITPAL